MIFDLFLFSIDNSSFVFYQLDKDRIYNNSSNSSRACEYVDNYV